MLYKGPLADPDSVASAHQRISTKHAPDITIVCLEHVWWHHTYSLETPALGGLLCQDMAACTKPRCDAREKPSLPFEAREEDPKSKARRTYNKSNKCEKCDERFISKDAWSEHVWYWWHHTSSRHHQTCTRQCPIG